MTKIRNIFCVGRNYVNHAKELGNEVPTSPMFFSKPTNALALADGSTLSYPNNRGEIHHELEVVLYIGRDVPQDFTVNEVVGKMALGIDLTLRDVQTVLKKKGHPWLKAKGFKNSAVITEFWDFPGTEACKANDFSLMINAELVQKGNIVDMLFNFQKIIQDCNDNFGLRKGDIIFTGTPEGVGPIKHGDTLQLYWENEVKGYFNVVLE